MTKKRIKATRYMESKIMCDRNEGLYLKSNPNGELFSQGRYPTKILPSDLPEWYVYGYMYKHHGYISAKGVRQLIYVPNYAFDNHLHKDDLLFISYDAEIVPYESERGFKWYKNYDEVLSGYLIVKFVEAAKKYSDYNTEDIEKEIERKREFYYERNPDRHA